MLNKSLTKKELLIMTNMIDKCMKLNDITFIDMKIRQNFNCNLNGNEVLKDEYKIIDFNKILRKFYYWDEKLNDIKHSGVYFYMKDDILLIDEYSSTGF